MLSTLIIVFREVFEAGMIVGIVAAVTKGLKGNALWIALGIVVGIIGSCIVAAFVGTIAAAFSGSGQELFNATILLVAVAMLGWHNVWMARHGREMAVQLQEKGHAIAAGEAPMWGLAIVIAVAIWREGSEVVLFLYGVSIAQGGPSLLMLLGGLVGLGLGVLVSLLTYLGLVRIPVRYLFMVTSALIAFLAAGMAAQAFAFLQQGGLVTALSRTVWNTSSILPDDTALGRVLHTLLGYTDRPSQMQLLVYLVTLLVIFAAMRWLAPDRGRSKTS